MSKWYGSYCCLLYSFCRRRQQSLEMLIKYLAWGRQMGKSGWVPGTNSLINLSSVLTPICVFWGSFFFLTINLACRGGTRSVQEQCHPHKGNSLCQRWVYFGTVRGDAAFVFWCLAGLVCVLGGWDGPGTAQPNMRMYWRHSKRCWEKVCIHHSVGTMVRGVIAPKNLYNLNYPVWNRVQSLTLKTIGLAQC